MTADRRCRANVVVSTPDYVRLVTHYYFRPDFCRATDPQSKGIVENLVGYPLATWSFRYSPRRTWPTDRFVRNPGNEVGWVAEVRIGEPIHLFVDNRRGALP